MMNAPRLRFRVVEIAEMTARVRAEALVAARVAVAVAEAKAEAAWAEAAAVRATWEQQNMPALAAIRAMKGQT